MGYLNQNKSDAGVLGKTPQPKIASPKEGEHLNWMGGISFTPGPLSRLQMAAASCFFGEPMYYHKDATDGRPGREYCEPSRLSNRLLDHLRETLGAVDPKEWRSMSPADMMVKAIDEALDEDAEKTLSFAAHLRQNLHIRVTPQVIMVRAAMHKDVKGTGLITRYAPQILQRLDEVATQYAYYLSVASKHTPPKSLKRNWARRIERAKAYELAKYRLEGHKVSLVDVINISHPKGDDISALMKGKLKLGGEQKTWESIRSAGGSWNKASKVMGHMALLRNLRNLIGDNALTKKLLTKLVETAPKGKQLPFRYINAYYAIKDLAKPQHLDAVEECLEASMENLPHFDGRVMSLVDNSGSAWGTMTSSMGTLQIANIGNLMGIVTAKASDEGYVGVFGNHLKTVGVRKKASVFDTLKKINTIGKGIGGGTEHGIWLFWKEAIEKKQHWDVVFVYSDMQAGHGGLYGSSTSYDISGIDGNFVFNSNRYGSNYIDVPALISAYRRKVNKNVHVVLCQIAGYQDTLVPEFYDKTYILGGWSHEVIRFANHMIKMSNQ